jgi:hypothetical protein
MTTAMNASVSILDMRHVVRRLYVDGPAAEFLPPVPPVVNVRPAAARAA